MERILQPGFAFFWSAALSRRFYSFGFQEKTSKTKRRESAALQKKAKPFNQEKRRIVMLKWAVIFLIISLVAALFGFGGIAQGAADIAKILFFIFLVICVIFFILGMTVYKSIP